MTLRALPLLLAGCLAQSAPPPTPPPPRATSGVGQLIGYFVSPIPGEPLTVRYVRDGAVVETATAPSGAFDVRLPSGRYRLELATSQGPIAGCDASIDVPPDTQTIVNQNPPPAGCTAWVRFDKQHPLERHRGALADVRTKPGTYDGYQVMPCDEPTYGLLYVLGAGTERPPENNDRTRDAAFNNWIDDKRHGVEAAMKPMSSGAGFGVSCRKGTAATINVYVSDYRQVDEVIRRLGAYIREQRLGMGFTIALMPIATLL